MDETNYARGDEVLAVGIAIPRIKRTHRHCLRESQMRHDAIVDRRTLRRVRRHAKTPVALQPARVGCKPMTLDEHVAAFRRAASAAGDLSDIPRQNRSADEVHLHAVALRETLEGRLALERLMTDTDPFVRGWAATDVLAWNPDAATKVLEELVASDGPGAFEAKWTLIVFRRGELKLDY